MRLLTLIVLVIVLHCIAVPIYRLVFGEWPGWDAILISTLVAVPVMYLLGM